MYFYWENVSSFCKCKTYSHVFSKTISVYAIFNDQRFNDMLINDIIILNNWALDFAFFGKTGLLLNEKVSLYSHYENMPI